MRLAPKLASIAICVAGVVAFFGASGISAAAAPPREPLPDGCQLPQVRSTVQGFFQAANSADPTAVARYVAPAGELNSFGVGSLTKTWLSSDDPGKVSRFFATRARAGYRLRFFGASVDDLRPSQLGGPWVRPTSGPAADDPVVALGFVARLNGGPPSLRQAIGKAGLNCVTGQFYNWQMGVEEPAPTRPCGNKPPIDVLGPPRSPLMCRTPF